MQLHPVPAFSDNYIWLLADDAGHALVVDPGDAAPVEQALAERGLTLTAILVTHHHPDHVGGIQSLLARHPVPVYGPADESIPGRTHSVRDGDRLRLDAPAIEFEVMHVPGHTLGHIVFFAADHEPPLLFCGDTLFAAGCGRLFEGTAAQMLASLDRLSALPDETLVCCAHEYTLSNLAFAQAVTPEDEAVLQRVAEMTAIREAGQPTLPVVLADERRSNPFLRVDEAPLQAAVNAHAGATLPSRTDVFGALRSWKDTF
ncbi:hydroxyacylglutathione hydrolase [Alcanivorax quisquiliarum]|uniref:Hydroxyacylglutathione hydrolase n=1 Tax=Alcanivorax quisquiliarum TaxID=2933565 RepID=A0ABT0E3Q8_9GAMM|nr:hydroxyacylglutathione hydrolase [Alcanivorax quisquiliarum]MCK0536453.1 hydroxyacylglutathione hydrolase [Alcanivorax quisquiliarum]